MKKEIENWKVFKWRVNELHPKSSPEQFLIRIMNYYYFTQYIVEESHWLSSTMNPEIRSDWKVS